MKIHTTLLFAAATMFGLQSAGATTVGISLSLSSLDSTVCTGASDCTETVTDIAPITASYSRSFESAFDVFGTSEFDLGDGKTLHGVDSGQGSNPYLAGLDRDPVFAFLPPIKVTAEQLATGTNSVVSEAFILDAGKTVITQDGGGVIQSDVSGDLFESQQWATTLPGGAWVSTQYAVDFSLFYMPVPMTVADLATPMSFSEFEARLSQQLVTGGDIFMSVTYILSDQPDSIQEVDTYSGVAHLTSLSGLAPVPEAPAPLLMLTGLLVVGWQWFRRNTQRTLAGHPASACA